MAKKPVMMALAALLLAGAPAAQPPGVRMVRVESFPPGARVYDGAAYVPGREAGFQGVTPFSMAVDPAAPPVLHLVLPGYAPERIALQPGQDLVEARLHPDSPASSLRHALRYRPLAAGLAAAGVAVLAALGLRRRREEARRLREAEELDPDPLGKVIDGYRLRGRLGRGTHSEVFLVEHLEHGDRFAMKRLKDRGHCARFGREVEAGRDLVHPNLVRVLAFGEDRGCPYLVMELLQGRTLQQRLSEGPLAVEEAVEVACQAAEGLAAAHSRGIVHRDLKPANLMLEGERVKVMDFGTARFLDRGRLTHAGTAMGTPLYMAPEQIAGDPVDPRCDVYALGAVLYEMLSGAPPFGGDNAHRVLAQHLAREAEPLRSRAPHVPEGLEAVVAAMLAKAPGDRPPSMEAVLERLGPWRCRP